MRATALVISCSSLLWPAVTLAHGAAHADEPSLSVLTDWRPDPWSVALLAVSLAVYVRGTLRLSKRRTTAAPTGTRLPAVAFALGWVAMAVALVSPLDTASDLLFSAHMGQHELLMGVVAPLFVFARPGVPALWALPEGARLSVGRALSHPLVRSSWRALTHPLVALVLHGAVRWVWHARPLFEAALESEAVHAFQHFTFFASAALFWWALVHGRYGRAGYGVGVLYVFATALHTGLLGALFTFAETVWYPLYSERAAAHGIDAHEDQGLAGLIMWMPAGGLLALLGLALFGAWLAESQRRTDRAAAARLAKLKDDAPGGTP